MDKKGYIKYCIFVFIMALLAITLLPYQTIHKVDHQIWYYSPDYSTTESSFATSGLTYSGSVVVRWISGMPYDSRDLRSSWYVLRIENTSYKANRCGDWDYISIAKNGTLDMTDCDQILVNNIYIEDGSKLITKEMFWVSGQELYIKPVEKPDKEKYWQ